MNRNIWVVDDDPIFRLIFSMTVSKLDGEFTICEHHNGKDILTIVDEVVKNTSQFPECLFIDINMPGMNGWDCLDRIKSLLANYHGPIPRIYIISSSIDPEDEIKALSHACTSGYLTKPITLDTFKSILAK